jgi:hypothetical protein
MADADAFANSERLEFPGYEQELTAGPRLVTAVRGLEPVTAGPVTVKVRFIGAHVSVDTHVDPIGPFGARDFRTLELYPGHLSDEDTIGYGVASAAKVTLRLKADPSTQTLFVHVEGKGLGIPFKTLNKSFAYSTFRLRDLRELAHPRWATVPQVQSSIDKGAWTRMSSGSPTHRNDAQTRSALQNTLTMAGGPSFIPDLQGYIGRFGTDYPAPRPDPTRILLEAGCLVALGVSGDLANVVSGGVGGGFYFTKGDFGVYGQGEAALGWMFGAELNLNYAVYWPSPEKNAFQNFDGLEWFVRLSGDVGIGVGITVSFDPPIRPVGVTLSAGTGAELAAGVGVAGTVTHSFAKGD